MPEGLMVATAVLLLVHVAPPVASLRVMEEPTHTGIFPVMGSGVGFTVTGVITEHTAPTPFEYVMVAVPAAAPLTSPPGFTVAIVVLLLLHVPPVKASDKSVVYPAQSVLIPVIAGGIGFTVTVMVV